MKKQRVEAEGNYVKKMKKGRKGEEKEKDEKNGDGKYRVEEKL